MGRLAAVRESLFYSPRNFEPSEDTDTRCNEKGDMRADFCRPAVLAGKGRSVDVADIMLA